MINRTEDKKSSAIPLPESCGGVFDLSEVAKIKNWASFDNAEAQVTVSKKAIIIQSGDYGFYLTDKKFDSETSHNYGEINLIQLLDRIAVRNVKLETSELSHFDFTKTVRLDSGIFGLRGKDVEAIGLLRQQDKSYRTFIIDSSDMFIFKGNHLKELEWTLFQSYSDALKKELPSLWNYLSSIKSDK